MAVSIHPLIPIGMSFFLIQINRLYRISLQRSQSLCTNKYILHFTEDAHMTLEYSLFLFPSWAINHNHFSFSVNGVLRKHHGREGKPLKEYTSHLSHSQACRWNWRCISTSTASHKLKCITDKWYNSKK